MKMMLKRIPIVKEKTVDWLGFAKLCRTIKNSQMKCAV
jgi:hypothetical protein